MPLITLRDVRVRFRGPPLLDNVSCHIEAGQRIGLLGRNGAGKTTLMRLVAGDLKPDGGEVLLAPGTRVAMLRQDVPQDVGGTIADVVATGLDAEALAASGDDEHDAARRAHQPPRPRCDRVAGNIPWPLGRHAPVRDTRPRVFETNGDADPGDRSGSAV